MVSLTLVSALRVDLPRQMLYLNHGDLAAARRDVFKLAELGDRDHRLERRLVQPPSFRLAENQRHRFQMTEVQHGAVIIYPELVQLAYVLLLLRFLGLIQAAGETRHGPVVPDVDIDVRRVASPELGRRLYEFMVFEVVMETTAGCRDTRRLRDRMV